MDSREYYAKKDEVRQRLAEEFKDTHQDLTDDRAYRNQEQIFLRQGLDRWNLELPLYASITMRRERNSVEIRDEFFNGSITVYGPERKRDWMTKTDRIAPGYINASSWCAGTHDSSVTYTTREMQHRMKMMELALQTLNELNQLCLEWNDIENPFSNTQWEKQELERFRENTRREREEANKKAAEKAARKAQKV